LAEETRDDVEEPLEDAAADTASRLSLPEVPIVSASGTTPAEREGYIRFALSNLGARNAHHEFEELCRRFAQARIASNILPATGPVSAGGDAGRDVETFHTVLKDELGHHGAFLGRVSDGLYVFTCTIQQDDLDKKIRDDVKKILSAGRTPAAIYAFCTGNLPVGKRKKLQTYIGKQFDGIFEIIDREALATQLAQDDLYWVGERYLDMPATLAPKPVEGEASELPQWYIEDRARWRERGKPENVPADILDLKDGLRYATRFAVARADLPFWLGLARELTGGGAAYEVRQRARYEVAYATMQALPELRPADELVRAFFDDLLDQEEIDAARYDDASTILLFATTSLYGGHTNLSAEELRRWNDELRARLRAALEDHERPTRRALLLEILGGLALHRDPLKLPLPEKPLPPVDVLDMLDESGAMPKVVVEPQAWPAVIDVEETMRAWGELADHLDETPLFPVDRFATRVGVMAPLLVDQAGYRKFIDAVDAGVGRVSGAAAVAERARDRGIHLREAGRTLDALHELHTAKIEWFKGDTLRGSLLAMLLIAECYRDLRMMEAAKFHALAVAYAASSGGDDVIDLVASGYLVASECDYASGAWCSAMELVDTGLIAQRFLVELDVDDAATDLYRRGIATIGFTLRIARQIAPKFVPFVEQIAIRHGLLDELNEIDKKIPPTDDADALRAKIDVQLLGRPLNDSGFARVIRFAALGTDWTVTSSNRFEDARAAERLAAAAQITLVELARQDLCLVPTTIHLRVEARVEDDGGEIMRWKPSNDGREWQVRLTGYDGTALDPEATQVELLSVISNILLDASLLPVDAYFAEVEDAFRRGLIHKLGSVRPFDELGVPSNVYGRTPRGVVYPPSDPAEYPARAADELHWRDGDGPTYDRDAAHDAIRRRYEKVPALLPRALARLRDSEPFLEVVQELKSRKWLDWHILNALTNYALNRLLHREVIAPSKEAHEARVAQLLDAPGSLDERPDDLLEPTIEDLETGELSQLVHSTQLWDLEIHQPTPDIPAIRTFLERRYHHFDDDVDHPSFFLPPAGATGDVPVA
jgi:hypothetical protein